jgi:hypothetical protein
VAAFLSSCIGAWSSASDTPKPSARTHIGSVA